MTTVADELRRWVAAARGALAWHLETGDAELPVPPGFRPPPLGAIAPAAPGAPVGQRGGASEARGGLQRLSAALSGAASGVSGVAASGGARGAAAPESAAAARSSVSRMADSSPAGAYGAPAPFTGPGDAPAGASGEPAHFTGPGGASTAGFAPAAPGTAAPETATPGIAPALPTSAGLPAPTSPIGPPLTPPAEAPAFDPRGLDERAAAAAALRVLRDEIGPCRRCSLSQGRTELVFGFGDPRARVMFVADQPGVAEGEIGLPFSDDGGRLLGRMIRAMGLSRSEVWLTYLVNCYDQDQQRPEPGLDACEPFLAREIEIVQPEVIIALGQLPATRLTGVTGQLPHLRGRWHPCRLGGRQTPVMVTFAPVALIQHPDIKRPVWEDLKQVMRRLGLPPPAR